ncbi:uncharacterized protein LOC119648504 [Hermetia illucens]|uniref:uncharacterized protein LOC119648504 n=1 Tax=Hermetia illucens TaxID=343691 RepID=UPI0018CBFDE1|nr:uncharacterized protein LOC119648504 [Hermetia illucens]
MYKKWLSSSSLRQICNGQASAKRKLRSRKVCFWWKITFSGDVYPSCSKGVTVSSVCIAATTPIITASSSHHHSATDISRITKVVRVNWVAKFHRTCCRYSSRLLKDGNTGINKNSTGQRHPSVQIHQVRVYVSQGLYVRMICGTYGGGDLNISPISHPRLFLEYVMALLPSRRTT